MAAALRIDHADRAREIVDVGAVVVGAQSPNDVTVHEPDLAVVVSVVRDVGCVDLGRVLDRLRQIDPGYPWSDLVRYALARWDYATEQSERVGVAIAASQLVRARRVDLERAVDDLMRALDRADSALRAFNVAADLAEEAAWFVARESAR